MDEDKRKALEIKAQNLMSLRSAYFTIVIGMTGFLFGLLYHISLLNIFLLVLGGVVDWFFVLVISSLSKQINKLIRFLGG